VALQPDRGMVTVGQTKVLGKGGLRTGIPEKPDSGAPVWVVQSRLERAIRLATLAVSCSGGDTNSTPISYEPWGFRPTSTTRRTHDLTWGDWPSIMSVIGLTDPTAIGTDVSRSAPELLMFSTRAGSATSSEPRRTPMTSYRTHARRSANGLISEGRPRRHPRPRVIFNGDSLPEHTLTTKFNCLGWMRVHIQTRP
jgi:hypothetical protein